MSRRDHAIVHQIASRSGNVCGLLSRRTVQIRGSVCTRGKKCTGFITLVGSNTCDGKANDWHFLSVRTGSVTSGKLLIGLRFYRYGKAGLLLVLHCRGLLRWKWKCHNLMSMRTHVAKPTVFGFNFVIDVRSCSGLIATFPCFVWLWQSLCMVDTICWFCCTGRTKGQFRKKSPNTFIIQTNNNLFVRSHIDGNCL